MKYRPMALMLQLLTVIATVAVFVSICIIPVVSSFAKSEKFEYYDSGKARERRLYNDQGNLIEKDYYRYDGTLEQRKRYDEHDHLIEESYYGSGGKLKKNSDGWAAIRWKYENGKIAEESYYGENGRLMERKQYNALGDLVAKQYVGDGSIDPSEEFNPMPTLTRETTSYYDSYGRPEGQTSAIRE